MIDVSINPGRIALHLMPNLQEVVHVQGFDKTQKPHLFENPVLGVLNSTYLCSSLHLLR